MRGCRTIPSRPLVLARTLRVVVSKSGSAHRFTLLDEENRPRPASWAYWLSANGFGRAW